MEKYIKGIKLKQNKAELSKINYNRIMQSNGG